MKLTGRIGEHYEIVTPLGSGAMGDVYRAVDRKMFDREVAIKVLNETMTDHDQGRARFRREIETSAKLHHPHIVRIYDWGEHEGRDFFVMELVDGRDLRTLLRDGVDWDLESRLQVAHQMADAIDFAHRAGVIHRDIKPGNMIVARSTSGPRVMLCDFGIARVEQSGLTSNQSQPGTFSYMSPEQLRGDSLDTRSDLFSLGIVFCELFAGQHPFAAKSDALVTARVLREDPDPPSRHAADLPRELDALILKMLEKDSQRRPAGADEVAAALREISRKTLLDSSSTERRFTGLADLEQQLVVSLVGWARQRESEGAVEDALAALEKARRLDPGNESIGQQIAGLEGRVADRRKLAVVVGEIERHLAAEEVTQAREMLNGAQALGTDDPRLASLERKIVELEVAAPEARQREEFVSARMKAIDTTLEKGNVSEARNLLAEILRKYPDQTDAALMLDRLVDIAAGGIPYAEYRSELRQARDSLNQEEFETATAHCGRARELWTDGPEISVLESEISRVREDVRRRTTEKQDAKRRQEEERSLRERELIDRYLDGVRASLTDARQTLDSAPDEPRRAIEKFSRAVGALDLVLSEWPDHAVAEELRREALEEIDEIEANLASAEGAAPSLPAPAAGNRRRGLRLAVAAVVTVVLIVAGLLVIRQALVEPEVDQLSERLEEVLALPEDTTDNVDTKLRQVSAIGELLTAEDERLDALIRQQKRLDNLREMHVNIERLQRLRGEAVEEPAGATGLLATAETVFEMIQAYRAELPEEDRTAERIVSRGQAIVDEIAGLAGTP